MYNLLLLLKKYSLKTIILLTLFLGGADSTSIFACDTSPTITASNVNNIGGGFFTIDVQVCIGTDGSQDGFDVTMGCGLNITATSAAVLNNGGKLANAGIAGGVLTYSYPGFPPTWWEVDDGIAGPCFNFTITVDGDPSNCSLTVTGINDNCLLIATSWSTTVPGPCVVDFTMTAPGSQAGNTAGAGNTCTARGSQDQIIQVVVPCDDTWTFDLCGTAWDTYLYLGTACCGTTSSNDDACGLQSRITQFLTAGTYFIIVEAFSTGTTGAYTLNVSSAAPCVLPVELISFNGTYDKSLSANNLSWSTSTEINNDFFTIEKSKDGKNFIGIGTIEGSGNSTETINYNFIDNNNINELSYYRLKQTDFNGDFEYSNLIVINNVLNENVFISNLYPNPTEDRFTFETNFNNIIDNFEVLIYNHLGKLIKKTSLNKVDNKHTISTDNINSGIYFVHFIIDGEKQEIKKLSIIKQ